LNDQQSNSEKSSRPKWNYKRQTDDSWQQTGDRQTFNQSQKCLMRKGTSQ